MDEYENHPSQKPESLLDRIIRASSREGDVVLDLFAGTFTTAAVAKKLQRRTISVELQKEYLKIGLRRVLYIRNFNGEELLPPELPGLGRLPTLQQSLTYIHRPPAGADVAALIERRHPAQQRLAIDARLVGGDAPYRGQDDLHAPGLGGVAADAAAEVAESLHHSKEPPPRPASSCRCGAAGRGKIGRASCRERV